MLDTLLHIGGTLRREGYMPYYIKPAPVPHEKSSVVYLRLPVNENFEFDFEKFDADFKESELLRERLFYLDFQTSDHDTEKKYLFGDIFYGTDKDGNEIGHYRMEKKGVKAKKSSFGRADKHAISFKGTDIDKFRESFRTHRERIEGYLREFGGGRKVFLHFDFFNGKHWYEFEDLNAIRSKTLQEVVDEHSDSFVLKKYYLKTMSADAAMLPDFHISNRYKTRLFSKDDFWNLFYALEYSKKALVRVGDIKIVVLPRSHAQASSSDDVLKAHHIEEFFNRSIGDETANSEVVEESFERVGRSASSANSSDELFAYFSGDDIPRSIKQYDFVFSRKEGNREVDLSEISGIQRSHLAKIGEKIREARAPLFIEREQLNPKIPKTYANFDIRSCFFRVLGDIAKSDKSKFNSHLLKVLPQIYTETYYRDDLLLPAFIKKTEYLIRRKEMDFNLLKFDYYLLARLRETKGVAIVDEMKNGHSYQAGELLGRLARPLRSRINTFATRYAGQITRHMTDKRGLQKLYVEFNQKLLMHKAHRPYLEKISRQATERINDLDERKFDKYECAFGFFEGYFAEYKPVERKEQEMDDEEVFDETERGEM